ncbi:MAG: hypothetical protein HXX10_15485 [Rhodoplanes sp.]|uniref:hypothetical protein n=1 Tax=Rhodoplanes sp. TaxID=1968906 RepID=UPI00184ECC9B|nr:hypothetical protein [Rhodoplanes sp.]NVO15431.1 hypothetical protein [Rhodoplanes sp.]
MNERSIFVSVGSTATDQQEIFVRAVEERLRSEGLIPCTVGRNTFSADAPLKAIVDLMDKCAGAVVIAFERMYFPNGIEKRGGPNQLSVTDFKIPTPWNQIEAAMAQSRGLPLLVIVEKGIQCGGLLEPGYNWYVQKVKLEATELNSNQFNGILADWKHRVLDAAGKLKQPKSASELTIAELVGTMKPSQLWSLLGALAVLIAGAFALGSKLFGA